MRCTVGLLSALLCCSLPAGAEENPLAGPHALDDGLVVVREHLEQGACKKGMDALNTLLAAHKDRNYAKARRDEIAELYRLLACGIAFPPPKPDDLVSGKVLSWSPRYGKLKIQYEPDAAGDFEQRKDMWYFPPRLAGPFTLDIRGVTYPGSANQQPIVTLGGEQHPETGRNQSWHILCGVPKNKEARGHIAHHDGLKETRSKPKAPGGKPGKPYRIQVRVAAKKVACSVNSRSIGSVSKPASVFGYIGFRAPTWSRWTFHGVIEPNWIESKIEQIVEGNLEEFDKTYKASDVVPQWLFDPILREKKKRKVQVVDLIADLSDKHYDAVLEVDNAIRMEEFDKALEAIDGLQQAGLDEATCEYLRARTCQHMTELEKAITHLKRCLELESRFLDGSLMLGTILRQMGRHGEAMEDFRKMAERNAQDAKTYEAAANEMMSIGRPDDARTITRLAARNGVTSHDLRKLNRAMIKIARGPRWSQRYAHESRNYYVMSNMDQTICREAADLLEEAYAAFCQTLGSVPRDASRRFRVYMFSTKQGFMGYQQDLSEYFGKPNDKAAGLYTPTLKQLLIWKHSSHESIMKTVRHEGFHQYLDQLMPGPPVWFNEGLAEYYENPVRKGEKLEFGALHRYHLHMLSRRGMRPMKKFLYGSPALFYDDGLRSYAQAWLLMHMFQHTTPKNAAFFKKLVAQLKVDPGYLVMKRLLPDSVIEKLGKDLKAYLKKLAD